MVTDINKSARNTPLKEPLSEPHTMETLPRSPSSVGSIETISDDELWEDEPEMNPARPDENSPTPPSIAVARGAGARKRKGRNPIIIAQPNPPRHYPSARAKSPTGDEPPLIDIDRARLRGAVRDGASYTLAYFFYVVKTALGLLRKPLAIALFLYFLSLILSQAHGAIRAVLAPVCWIPGMASTPLCYVPPSAPQGARWADYPKLVEVQSSRLELLMGSNVGNSAMSQGIQKAETAINELIVLVKVSDLKSKETLARHLEGFVADAKKVGRGLQRLSSRISGAVDSIIAINDYALHTIADAQSKPTSGLSVLWPFSSSDVAVRETVRETFSQSMSVAEAHMHRLIIEAEASLGFLEDLGAQLETLHGYIALENTTLRSEREDILAELWLWFGPNKEQQKELRGKEEHLSLLENIDGYRYRAVEQVSGALQTLKGMSEDMADLRERVAAPELLGDRIPVEVHLKSIMGGLERLQADRKRARELNEEKIR